MSTQRFLMTIAAAFAFFAVGVTGEVAIANAQGNSAGQGNGGGHGHAHGRGGSAGGAPLPLLGATVLGQAAGAGGLFLIWLRRRNKRAKARADAA